MRVAQVPHSKGRTTICLASLCKLLEICLGISAIILFEQL